MVPCILAAMHLIWFNCTLFQTLCSGHVYSKFLRCFVVLKKLLDLLVFCSSTEDLFCQCVFSRECINATGHDVCRDFLFFFWKNKKKKQLVSNGRQFTIAVELASTTKYNCLLKTLIQFNCMGQYRFYFVNWWIGVILEFFSHMVV